MPMVLDESPSRYTSEHSGKEYVRTLARRQKIKVFSLLDPGVKTVPEQGDRRCRCRVSCTVANFDQA